MKRSRKTTKVIFWNWMRRIGSPTDCGYCNNWILIFRLLVLISILHMSQTFIDRVDEASHDECVIKYNKMLNQLSLISEVPTIDVANVPRNENLSFMMVEPYNELKKTINDAPTVT